MKALWLVKLLDPPTERLCSVEVRMDLDEAEEIVKVLRHGGLDTAAELIRVQVLAAKEHVKRHGRHGVQGNYP